MLEIVGIAWKKTKEIWERFKSALIKRLHWGEYIQILLILLLFKYIQTIPEEFFSKTNTSEFSLGIIEEIAPYIFLIVFVVAIFYFIYRALLYTIILHNISFKGVSASILIILTLTSILGVEYIKYLGILVLFVINILIIVGSLVNPTNKKVRKWIAANLILGDTEIKRSELSIKLCRFLGGFSFIRKQVISRKHNFIRKIFWKFNEEEWIDLIRCIRFLEKEEDRIKLSEYISPEIFKGLYSIILRFSGNFKGSTNEIKKSLSSFSIMEDELKDKFDRLFSNLVFLLVHIILFFEIIILFFIYYIFPQIYSNITSTSFFELILAINALALFILLFLLPFKFIFLYPYLIYRQLKAWWNVAKTKKMNIFKKMTIRCSRVSVIYEGLAYYKSKITNNKKDNKINLLYNLSTIINFRWMNSFTFLVGNTFPIPMYKNVKMNISKVEKELDRYQNKESLSNEEIKEIAEIIVKYSEPTLFKVDNTFSVNIDKIISVFIQYLCLNYLHPSSRKKRCKIEFSDDIFPAFNEIWIREKKKIEKKIAIS